MNNMTIRTGSFTYITLGFEDTYGGGATEARFLGKDQKPTFTFGENPEEFPQLNSAEIVDYGFGKREGSANTSFTLSNPFPFHAIFGDVTRTETTNNATYVWKSSTQGYKEIVPCHIRFGINTSTAIVRNAKGAMCTSTSLKTSIGQKVDVTQSFIWGMEDAVDTTFGSVSTQQAAEAIYNPMMFHNAQLQLPSGTRIVGVQDLTLDINTNAEQWYELNNYSSTDGAKKIINVTGKFGGYVIDKANFDRVYNRAIIPNMKIIIDNKQSSSASRKIEILLERVVFDKHDQAFEPGEVILQNVSFKAQSITVTAITNKTEEYLK